MHDNEEDLDNFYNRWKDIGGGPIIQKHNSFSGSLANLQPAELSPLKRFPLLASETGHVHPSGWYRAAVPLRYRKQLFFGKRV